VTTFVKYDAKGTLTAVVAVEVMPDGADSPWGPLLAEGEQTAKLSDAQLAAVQGLELHEILEQFRFDAKKSQLVKLPAAKQ